MTISVMMMIPHHQGEVDRAENEISHCKHFEMKKFAQKIYWLNE